MTTRTLSSKKGKTFDISLWKNMFRRAWGHGLLDTLAIFFTFTVPVMMALPGLMESDLAYRASNVASLFTGVSYFNLPVLFLLSLYAGCVSVKYLMNRKCAYFYHSLPERRESLFLANITVPLAWFCAAAIINGAIVMLLITVYGAFGFVPFGAVIGILVRNLAYFALVFGITVFVGSVCGTGIMQFLLTLVAFFYIPLTYLGVVRIHSYNSVYFNTDFYFSDPSIFYTSPVGRAMYEFEKPLSIWEIILFVVITLLLLGFSMLIYRARKIEKSETPIIFDKLGSFLKYLVLVPGTIYFGLFFGVIGTNRNWIYFGFACGIILVSMLANAILNKSAKAVFAGWRGLIVFTVCFALFFTIVGLDIFGTDKSVPKADSLQSVDICLSGSGYYDSDNVNYTDAEMIKLTTELAENAVGADEFELKSVEPAAAEYDQAPTADYILFASNSNYYRYDLYERVTVNVVFRTKLGLPIAKTYRVKKSLDGVQELLRAIANSEKFESEFRSYFTLAKDKQIDTFNLSGNFISDGRYFDGKCADFYGFVEAYEKDIPDINYDIVSQPTIGSFSLAAAYDKTGERIDGLGYSTFPLYAFCENTLAFIEQNAVIEPNGKYEYNNEQILAYEVITNAGGRTGTAKIDDAVGAEYVKNMVEDNYGSLYDMFISCDDEYAVVVYFKNDYNYYDDGDENHDYHDFECKFYRFTKGKVPSEIKALQYKEY